MLDGVTIAESSAQKDELILEGNDIDNVSQSGERSAFSCKRSLLTHKQLPQSKASVA